MLDGIQAELRTTLYVGTNKQGAADEGDTRELFAHGSEGLQEDSLGTPNAADVSEESQLTPKSVPPEPLKVYALLPLDSTAARLYLGQRHQVENPKELLRAARQFGLGGLSDGPGGLDVLAFVDPVANPPRDLTDAFDRMVQGVQAQQRADSRERRVGSPSPESLTSAVEKLASASMVCRLPNIELSPEALDFREGVLSARPIVGSLLSQDSLAYLLGSRLFIDSGHHQVKVYPDELLPYLAAKRLSARVNSPEDAARLLACLSWSSPTGECGVHRVYLPLAGWLSTFNAHCRHVLLGTEPQAVAFFGDLRNVNVPLADASTALREATKRLVETGDTLGRLHYTLTAENFWQVAKVGIEDTLRDLFELYGDDWHARDALLDIATYGRLDLFREKVLQTYAGDYSRLLTGPAGDLHYILSLERADDGAALARALLSSTTVPEQVASSTLAKLAWTALDARAMADVAARHFVRGRSGFHIDWALTHDVADSAEASDLYALTKALLLRLVHAFKADASFEGGRRIEHDFVELVMDLLAIAIERSASTEIRLARLCLVLHRVVRDFHQSSADSSRLRSALAQAAGVRRLVIRCLIEGTDKSSDGIWRALFIHGSFVIWLDGDAEEIAEPAFAQLVAEMKAHATKAPPVENRRRDRSLELEGEAKRQLLDDAESIRDGTNERALRWVARWLVQTIHNSRYGECDFSVFAAQAGDDLAAAVRSGLAAVWRTRGPEWQEHERNTTYNITVAGLQGLHLELADGSSIPTLSEPEVRQAIRYAQFEINGFPKWFWPLVSAHDSVALEEFKNLLNAASAGPVSADKAEALIRHLDRAPLSIQRGLGKEAWLYATGALSAQEYATESALEVATADGGAVDRSEFETIAWARMTAAYSDELPVLADAPAEMGVKDAQVRQALEALIKERRRLRASAVVWGAFWLWRFPDSFGQAWERWRSEHKRAAEEFMLDLAGSIGEDRKSRLRDAAGKGSEGLRTLGALYEWVASVVRAEDDDKHEDFEVYSAGTRDHAERLRDALLPAIASAKSQAAYDVLDALRGRADGPRAKYIRHLQFTMREDEASVLPLAQQKYEKFEHDFAPPVTGYLSFAQAIHNDLLAVKRDIEQGEFSLRRFFNTVNFKRIKTDGDGLALEEDFQSLLGSELNHACAGRYAVTLEPMLPESTRRDVLCQVGSCRATIELKMSERWTVEDYLVALDQQLKGQYMQSANSKIGFFVVVLQRHRQWERASGGNVDFPGLLNILMAKALTLQSADPTLFLRVVGIDAAPKEDFRAVRAAKKPDSKGAQMYADKSGNTWGGKGRRPRWLKDALASGQSLEDFQQREERNLPQVSALPS